MRDRKNPGAEPSLNIAPGLGNVLFDVWLVSRAVHDLIDDAIRSAGLDADEYAIYSVLASGDALTPTELAQWMAAPPTTVSSYIKRFEKRGHMVRVTNPEDGRSHRVQLTAEGQQAHKRARRLFRPVLAQVEQSLAGRADQTHQQLRALHQVIDVLRHST
jgi:DNA-binding MarR family transcriptional regulator